MVNTKMTIDIPPRPPPPPPPPLIESPGPIHTSLSSSCNSQSSQSSRDNLRLFMNQRSYSMTQSEFNFLEGVVTEGDDHLVIAAHNALADDKLFPCDNASNDASQSSMSNGISSCPDDPLYSNNNIPARSPNTASSSSLALRRTKSYRQPRKKHNKLLPPSSSSSIPKPPSAKRSTSETRSLNRGDSERHISQRMTTDVYVKLWKAHERGIAVTPQGSQQSLNKTVLLKRQLSNSSVASSTVANGGEATTGSGGGGGGGGLMALGTLDVIMASGRTVALGRRRVKSIHARSSSYSRMMIDGCGPPRPPPPPPPAAATHHVSSDKSSDVSGILLDDGDDDDDDDEGTMSTTSGLPLTPSNVSGLPPPPPDVGRKGRQQQQQRHKSFGSLPPINDIDDHVPSTPPIVVTATPERKTTAAAAHENSSSLSSIPNNNAHYRPPVVVDVDISSIPPLSHASRLRSESSILYNDTTSDLGAAATTAAAVPPTTAPASIPPLQRATRLRSETSLLSSLGSEAFESLLERGVVEMIPPNNQSIHLPSPPRSSFRRCSSSSSSRRSSHSSSQQSVVKPVLLRKASRNCYEGEGVEVSDPAWDSIEQARNYGTLLSMDDSVYDMLAHQQQSDVGEYYGGMGIERASSYEHHIVDAIFRQSETRKATDETDDTSMASWDPMDDMDDVDEPPQTTPPPRSTSQQPPPPPLILPPKPQPISAWSRTPSNLTTHPPFLILGTSASDASSHPHVLSPPLMESIQSFLPYAVTEQNFWMKYSLMRDGASLYTLLKHVRGSDRTIIAIETSRGEVFGSFTSVPWRLQQQNGMSGIGGGGKYFGNGQAFLWRMRRNRRTPCKSVIDQAKLESELEVFSWTGENNMVQYCTNETLAVGGGMMTDDDVIMPTDDDNNNNTDNHSRHGGFGLVIDGDLLMGASSPCETFRNPSLVKEEDGMDGVFEIANLEVWTLTPCMTEKEAETMEFRKIFFDDLRNQ